MPFLPETRSIQQGLHTAARAPLAPRTWNLVMLAWLALVVGVFLKIRILESQTVTHLLRKFLVR